MHIEDTNGLEDYSLQEITEEDILTSTRVLYQMSIENSKIENGVQIVSKSAKVFTGVDCLEKLTVKSPFTITITTLTIKLCKQIRIINSLLSIWPIEKISI